MVNLTGLWSANDGGTYYLKQEGAALWWAGLSNDGLQNGLRFSNVFLGVVSEGEFGPESIDGRWVGVPRGTLMGTGALQLAINIDAAGNLVSLTKQGFSGGFHASLWLPVGKTAKAPNITEIFRLVKKNQNSDFPFPDHSLLDNLTPYRDHGVIFGKVVADPVNRPVHVNYRPDDGRQYQDFICLDDNQSPPDGDLNLEIQVDRVQLNEQTGFWTDGWTDGGSKFPANFKNKLDSGNNMLHLEAIMFGRVAECGDVQNYDLPPLLPGWQEQIGDSVLLSGQPMNGNVMIGAQDPLIGGYSATLTPMVKVGDYIRITGVLAMDIGHHGFFDAFRSDTEHRRLLEEDPSQQIQEIHPVYSIDIVNPTATADLTGVWADSDGSTYYLAQVGLSLWGLGMSPFRDGSFGTVLRGSIQNNQRVEGEWVDLPLGQRQSSGILKVDIDAGKLILSTSASGPFATLRRLYDAPIPHRVPAIQILPTLDECNPVEVASTVTFSVEPSGFPAQTVLSYSWTVVGAIGETDNAKPTFSVKMPASPGQITVNVTIEDGQGGQLSAEQTLFAYSAIQSKLINLVCALRTVVIVNPFPSALWDPTRDLPGPAFAQEVEEIRNAAEGILQRATDLLRLIGGGRG